MMTLQEQFPVQFAQWRDANGVENNFRKHLLALGVLSATEADLDFLFGEIESAVEQAKAVAHSLPLVPADLSG